MLKPVTRLYSSFEFNVSLNQPINKQSVQSAMKTERTSNNKADKKDSLLSKKSESKQHQQVSQRPAKADKAKIPPDAPVEGTKPKVKKNALKLKRQTAK